MYVDGVASTLGTDVLRGLCRRGSRVFLHDNVARGNVAVPRVLPITLSPYCYLAPGLFSSVVVLIHGGAFARCPRPTGINANTLCRQAPGDSESDQMKEEEYDSFDDYLEVSVCWSYVSLPVLARSQPSG